MDLLLSMTGDWLLLCDLDVSNHLAQRLVELAIPHISLSPRLLLPTRLYYCSRYAQRSRSYNWHHKYNLALCIGEVIFGTQAGPFEIFHPDRATEYKDAILSADSCL